MAGDAQGARRLLASRLRGFASVQFERSVVPCAEELWSGVTELDLL